MKLSESKILVIDTETTGLDVENDQILELGVNCLWGRGREWKNGTKFFKPTMAKIGAEAVAVHHIDDLVVADCPPFTSFLPRLRAQLAAVDVVVGYNALHFDIPLLRAEAQRGGESLEISRVLDPKIFVDWLHRGERKRTQEAMAAYYKIPIDGALHSAKYDVVVTTAMLWAMVDAGDIPDDVDAALTLQRELSPQIEEEFDKWSYWLYRRGGKFFIGAGKHCGGLLSHVPKSYLGYLLNTITDLPEATREVFEAAVRGEIDNLALDIPPPPTSVVWGGR